MSQLTIYEDKEPYEAIQSSTTFNVIHDTLKEIGVRFERWDASVTLPEGADQEAVLAAYSASIEALKNQHGYTTADVVSLTSDHPDKQAFREKFLSEHRHSEDEVRFFVQGHGLFCLHSDNQVFAVHCQAGDLISVPDNMPHWFDMGSEPNFTCIRIFTNTEGWIARFTGSLIADFIPNLDTYHD